MARIKKEVDSLILEKIIPKDSSVREIELLYKMMRDYPERPAKGTRPFLCVATCNAMGGKESDSLLTAACIELFQNWVLIHDDIEDGSDLRRGRPTLHKEYGVALALNAGDALHAKMWEALTSNRELLGYERTFEVLSEFSRIVNKTTEGQHMELVWIREGRWDLTEQDYFEMCKRKTSWYTVAGPCRLGAIIAGCSSKALDELLDFGTELGIGFQIQDDTLNLVGKQEKYGKERLDDLLEGKRTLIMIRLLESASREERERVIRIMSKKREEKTQDDLDYVMKLIGKYDVISYARGVARKLMRSAVQRLDRIEWRGNKEYLEMIKELSAFMVEREW